MKPEPYIGVSGVITPDQQEWISRIADSKGNRGNRKLLFGVKAMDKTYYLKMENKYGPLCYPVGDDVGKSLELSPDNLCVPQIYLDYKSAAERGEGPKMYQENFLHNLIDDCAPWINGIQFDMLAWHSSEEQKMLESLRKYAGQNFRILIQCYGKQMEENTPYEIVEKLKGLEGIVDYILFDSSHGTRKTLDVEVLEPFVEKASGPDWLGVGIAGGFDGPTIREYLPNLFKNYPDLSIDAEGKLHQTPDGILDRKVVGDYLDAAVNLNSVAQ